MKAQYLGHVVFYVRDLERSLAFYRDLLGFQEVGRIFQGAAAALTSGPSSFCTYARQNKIFQTLPLWII